jgi:hypothetical protein
MPSNAVTADDSPETQAKREFDRWRIAVDLVQRLREAGIDCELAELKNRPL